MKTAHLKRSPRYIKCVLFCAIPRSADSTTQEEFEIIEDEQKALDVYFDRKFIFSQGTCLLSCAKNAVLIVYISMQKVEKIHSPRREGGDTLKIELSCASESDCVQ